MRINPDKQTERHRIAHRRQPRGANRSDKKIRPRQNQVRGRQRPSKAQTIGNRSPKNRQKPHHAAEYPGQRPRLLSREIEFLLQI